MKESVDYYVALGALFIFCWWMGFEYGKMVKPKVCAKVEGMTVVSTTPDSCTYIVGAFGKAHWKRLAIEESKK